MEQDEDEIAWWWMKYQLRYLRLLVEIRTQIILAAATNPSGFHHNTNRSIGDIVSYLLTFVTWLQRKRDKSFTTLDTDSLNSFSQKITSPLFPSPNFQTIPVLLWTIHKAWSFCISKFCTVHSKENHPQKFKYYKSTKGVNFYHRTAGEQTLKNRCFVLRSLHLATNSPLSSRWNQRLRQHFTFVCLGEGVGMSDTHNLLA